MSTLLIIAIGLGGASALVAGHVYLYRRLGRDLSRRRWPRVLVGSTIGSLALLALLSMILPRSAPQCGSGPLIVAGLMWVACVFYLIVCLLLADLARLLVRLARRSRAKRPEAEQGLLDRRQFLSRVVAGAAVAGTSGIAIYGVHSAVGEIATPEVTVPLARLPKALSGFRIALLCDLHLGPVLGRGFLREVVSRTLSLRPDLIAVAGDLADGPAEVRGPAVQDLARLQAPHGVFFVTGNHEYYFGVQAWLDLVRKLGLRVLANEHVYVGDGPAGSRFCLAGVHDASGGRFDPAFAADLPRALEGRQADEEVVLLAHQPCQIDEAARHGVGLQLSGHTHGGQLMPFGLLVVLNQPYLAGLHRHGQSWIYVSRGTGCWGPPMRVGAPPEITNVVLVSGRSET
ncbi:MAG: metallophosphoesterase [Deltaproteobacteria bacterium]|nr:metallophosphoesterase [Deltaproteobacteria bacterium]